MNQPLNIIGSYNEFEIPEWLKLKDEAYEKCASHKLDEISFCFHEPEWGWMDFDVYINGEEAHSAVFSEVYCPFEHMKTWMESIANDTNQTYTLGIDAERSWLLFHYEPINSEVGLFCIHESYCDRLPVVCMCSAKQLLASLYNKLIERMLCDNTDLNWYGDDQIDEDENNHILYNIIKSPLIESFISDI
jgi:hypothetical protein